MMINMASRTDTVKAIANSILKTRWYDYEPDMYESLESFYDEIDEDHVMDAYNDADAVYDLLLEIGTPSADSMKQLTATTAFHLGVAVTRAEAYRYSDKYGCFVLIYKKDEDHLIDTYILEYKDLFFEKVPIENDYIVLRIHSRKPKEVA